MQCCITIFPNATKHIRRFKSSFNIDPLLKQGNGSPSKLLHNYQ